MTDDRSVDPWVARVRDTTARGANIAETRNVTVVEQIEAEEALRESEARFRELADNISQFAWTADHTGWIYWYNKRRHDYTGTTLEEMQGWGWQKVHHPDHVDRVVVRIRRSFESGEAWEDTFPLRGRDGSYRWFLSRSATDP
jgi:PAS domain S-box-containing protein